MGEPEFRTCRKEDLTRVAQLVRGLYELDRAQTPVSPNIELTFTEFKNKPDKGTIIVFCRGAEVVGYAILVSFWSNEFCGDILEVDELFIDEAHRGKGIGEKFFAWLEAFDQNAIGFTLQVSPNNTGAQRFYERIGFVRIRDEKLIKLIDRTNS